MRAIRLLEGVPTAPWTVSPSRAARLRREYARPVVTRMRLENVVRGSGGTKKDSTFPSTNPFPG